MAKFEYFCQIHKSLRKSENFELNYLYWGGGRRSDRTEILKTDYTLVHHHKEHKTCAKRKMEQKEKKRIYVDYRALNDHVAMKNKYALPRINYLSVDIINFISGQRTF